MALYFIIWKSKIIVFLRIASFRLVLLKNKSLKKTLYILRHGETELNRLGILQGRSMNAPLNAAGKAQAKTFFEYYHYVPFDHLYHSALVRTKETIAPFLSLQLPATEDARIDEINWGPYEGRPPSADTVHHYEKTVAKWRCGETHTRPEGGESLDELWLRVAGFMKDLEARQDLDTVLICSHGRTIKTMLCYLTGTPLSRMDHFPHKNTALYIFEEGDLTAQCSVDHLLAGGISYL